MASVRYSACNYTNGKQEEDLDAPNPGYGGFRLPQGASIVFLEDAVSIGHTPGIEEDNMHQYDMKPSSGASIWRWRRVWQAIPDRSSPPRLFLHRSVCADRSRGRFLFVAASCDVAQAFGWYRQRCCAALVGL
ncbi:hypothetical protein J3459_018648 [Metarhizium acridum]|nr:hypothetical protein J3459_018648 [Metarhizium acridum]